MRTRRRTGRHRRRAHPPRVPTRPGPRAELSDGVGKPASSTPMAMPKARTSSRSSPYTSRAEPASMSPVESSTVATVSAAPGRKVTRRGMTISSGGVCNAGATHWKTSAVTSAAVMTGRTRRASVPGRPTTGGRRRGSRSTGTPGRALAVGLSIEAQADGEDAAGQDGDDTPEPWPRCQQGVQPRAGRLGVHEAVADVVDESVERVDLVEPQGRAGAGLEVHPTRVARLDADEDPGRDDEERHARGGIHPGHLLEDVGDALRRISRPRQGHAETPEQLEDRLGRRRGHGLRLGVGRATQGPQTPMRNPRQVRHRLPIDCGG